MSGPDTLSVPLACWLRADTVVLDGEHVTLWPDRSGHGRDNTPLVDNYPTLVNPDPAFNNQPTVHFDAQRMEASGGGVGNPWTLMVVGGQANQDTAFFSSPLTPPEQVMLFLGHAGPSGTQPVQWQTDSVLMGPTDTPSEDGKLAILLEGSAVLSGFTLWVQSFAAPAAVALGPVYDVWPLGMGSNETDPPTAGRLEGKIAEFCLWEGALTDEDRVALQTYVAERYATPPPVPTASTDDDGEFWQRFCATHGA